jgi:hypothetical protein
MRNLAKFGVFNMKKVFLMRKSFFFDSICVFLRIWDGIRQEKYGFSYEKVDFQVFSGVIYI